MSERSALENQSVTDAAIGTESDEVIIARVLNGEHEAYRVLVERYQRAIFSCAWQHLGSAAEAEEAAQETFVQAFEKLARLREPARFFSWAWRICSTVSLKRRRSERRMVRGIEFETVQGPDFEAPCEGEERRQVIALALGQLPEEQREVLTLRYWEGLDYDRIAEIVGVSHDALYQRVSRGLRKLQELLGEDIQP